MPSQVQLMGCELEGNWKDPIEDEDTTIVYEQSVRRIEGYDHWGEVISPPMTLEKLQAWLLKFYPDATDQFCGFHVHASLKNIHDYAALMEPEFYDHFRDRCAAWGVEKGFRRDSPFFTRLSGTHPEWARFCWDDFKPAMQYNQDNKAERGFNENRRTQLNYCFAQHGTIECRMFPMFETAEQASDSLVLFRDIIDGFLKSYVEVPLPALKIDNFSSAKRKIAGFGLKKAA